MDERTGRRMRLLEAHALVSTTVLLILALTAFSRSTVRERYFSSGLLTFDQFNQNEALRSRLSLTGRDA
jgi:hypothetical protein